MFPVSICLFMFLQRREKPLMQLPQKSRCQQFGAVPSVPVFCFSCLSSPSRLMLHFAFPRCIRRVKEWSEHIRGNPLFAWWTYLFTPGSSHLEVITAPLSQPLITGFVVQSRSFKSSQLERLYLTVLPSPPLDQWEIVLLNTFLTGCAAASSESLELLRGDSRTTCGCWDEAQTRVWYTGSHPEVIVEESSAGRHQPRLRCRDENRNVAKLRIGGD